MSKREQIEVHDISLLSVTQLKEDPRNTQKQSRKVFNDLKENIRKHGFDEPLLVTVNEDDTYTIRSGNHRFRAGKSLGMVDFPCIVHRWDELEAALQNVRRNVSRGAQDAGAFTSLVDHLKLDFDTDVDTIMEGMAFADDEDFARLYQIETESGGTTPPSQNGGSRNSTPDSAHKTKMLDDLGIVLSHIFDEFGGSVPCSFIVFPASGKHHMFVQATNSLKKVLAPIAERCLQENIDINVALTGLLQIGISQTSFLQPKGDSTRVKSAEREVETNLPERNLESIGTGESGPGDTDDNDL